MGPSNNGGDPVSQFVLQMREASMRDWMDNCTLSVEDIESECDLYRGRCENLQEEYEYRFRIIAINKAGRSPPSPSSDNVVAMHKNISPFIKVIICYLLFNLAKQVNINQNVVQTI